MQFLLRYFPRQLNPLRRWLNAQMVLVVSISSVFLVALAMTAPLSEKETATPAHIAGLSSMAGVKALLQQRAVLQETATPEVQEQAQQVEPSPTQTSLPPEYRNNANQTIGITLAAAVLVIIVVFGVLMFMPKRDDNAKPS